MAAAVRLRVDYSALNLLALARRSGDASHITSHKTARDQTGTLRAMNSECRARSNRNSARDDIGIRSRVRSDEADTRAGGKMLDHGTDSGDLSLERQATFGMSVH